MKNFLKGFTFVAILSLTACAKENLTVADMTVQPEQSEQVQKSRATNRAQSLAVTNDVGFDNEVFDVPLQIKTSLTYTPTGGTMQVLDIAQSWFNGNYSNSIVTEGGEDVIDATPVYEQLAIRRNTTLLAKEGRLVLASGYRDTIQLVTSGYRFSNYKIRVQPAEFPTDFSIQLYDNYTSVVTNIPLTGTTFVPFTVGVRGGAPDRFKLIVGRN